MKLSRNDTPALSVLSTNVCTSTTIPRMTQSFARMTSTTQKLAADCPTRDLFLRTSNIREAGLAACAKFRGEERTGRARPLFVARVWGLGVSTGSWWSVAWIQAEDLGTTRDRWHERREAASASHFVKGRLQTGRAETFVVFSFTAIAS